MNTFRKTLIVIGIFITSATALAGFAHGVSAAQPTLMTTAASGVTQTSATLNGFYSFTGTTIDVRFAYGTSPLLGSFTSYQTKTNASGNFSAEIAVQPGQQYFFRAEGVTPGQMPGFGSTLSFSVPAYQTPTVMTTAASNITSTTATLGGFFTANGSSTSTKFEYANNSAFIGTIATPLVVQVNGSGPFSANITGLTANTTYYFRAIAKNSGGTTNGSVLTFHTQNTQSSPCVIGSFTANPGTITPGSTTLLSWSTTNCTGAAIGNIGTVAVNGSATTPTLYSSTTYTLTASGSNGNVSSSVLVTVSSTNSTCVINSFSAYPSTIGSGNSSLLSWSTSHCTNAVISTIGNVVTSGSTSTGTLYSTTIFTLSASGTFGNPTQQTTVFVNNTTNYECNDGYDNDGDGDTDYPNDSGCSSYTDDSEYSSQNNSEPDVTTDNATDIYEEGATLNGYVDSNGSYTYTWFEYGTNTSLYESTDHVSFGTGSGDVSESIGDLQDNRTYYFRICASNSHGSDCGSIEDFETDDSNNNRNGDEPSANTSSAQNVTQNSANLYGYVDPNDLDTDVWFEYGTNSNLSSTAYPNPDTIDDPQNVHAYVSGLNANTTYYFRVCASNDDGEDCGSMLSFYTAGTQSVYNPTPYYPQYPNQTPQTIVVYQNSGTTESSGESQLAVLKLTASARSVTRDDTVLYTVALTNTAPRTLTNVTMRLVTPRDLSLISTTDGELSFASNSVTLTFPKLAIGAAKTFTVTARVKEKTDEDSFVVHSDASYTNTKTGSIETATAELITNVKGNGFLANVFGSGATLGTLVGILLAILVLLMIFLLARKAHMPQPVRQPVPLPPAPPRNDFASPYR